MPESHDACAMATQKYHVARKGTEKSEKESQLIIFMQIACSF